VSTDGDGGVEAPDAPLSVDDARDASDESAAPGESDASDAMAVDAVEAGDDGSSRPDSGEACGQTRPFGLATLANGNDSTKGDVEPWLSRDELTMYFASNRGGGQGAIYVTTRPSLQEPFGPASLVPGLAASDPSSSDGRPALPADELTIYFESTRSGRSNIHYSTRASKQDAWSAPQLVPGVSDGVNDDAGGPFIMPSGNVLYFHSLRGSCCHQDIFRTERVGGGWSPPTRLANVSWLLTDDLLPVVSDDELTMFFMTTRSDVNGDIWVATRRSLSEDFGDQFKDVCDLALVTELQTTQTDGPSWLSPDGLRLYITRSSSAGSRIYVTSRPPAANLDAGAL
jgi:hypothetical protein